MQTTVHEAKDEIPCSVCLHREIAPARDAVHTIKIQYVGRNARATSPRLHVCKIHFDEYIKLDNIKVC